MVTENPIDEYRLSAARLDGAHAAGVALVKALREVERLRAELAEARRENEALAKALDRLAHEFEPGPRNGPLFCEDCAQMAVTKAHQTSATVRRALTGSEGGDSGGE